MKNSIIIFLLSLISLKTFACDCGKILLPQDIDMSELVFTGTMMSAIHSKDNQNITVEFEIIDLIKTPSNKPSKRIKLLTNQGPCGLHNFEFGYRKYAVFLRKDAKTIGWCNAKALDYDDNEFIKKLNAYK